MAWGCARADGQPGDGGGLHRGLGAAAAARQRAAADPARPAALHRGEQPLSAHGPAVLAAADVAAQLPEVQRRALAAPVAAGVLPAALQGAAGLSMQLR